MELEIEQNSAKKDAYLIDCPIHHQNIEGP